jgi:hypothetical protein
MPPMISPMTQSQMMKMTTSVMIPPFRVLCLPGGQHRERPLRGLLRSGSPASSTEFTDEFAPLLEQAGPSGDVTPARRMARLARGRVPYRRCPECVQGHILSES